MIDFKGEILGLVSIHNVVEAYGYTPDNKGFINCPFHSEKTASCKIYPKTNTFYCFGCGAGGNVIDFVSKLNGTNFKDTLKLINRDFDLNLPFDRQITLREKSEFKRRAKKKEEQERKERERKEKIYSDYWLKFDRYKDLLNQRQKLSPKQQNGELDPKFVKILHSLDLAEYELNVAESEVMKIVN